MIKEVEAVYQNGMLRPLETLPLAENQHVKVVVEEILEDALAPMVDLDFLAKVTREVASAGPIPTLEEVRQLTASDHSSWAELIVAQREDRS